MLKREQGKQDRETGDIRTKRTKGIAGIYIISSPNYGNKRKGIRCIGSHLWSRRRTKQSRCRHARNYILQAAKSWFQTVRKGAMRIYLLYSGTGLPQNGLYGLYLPG